MNDSSQSIMDSLRRIVRSLRQASRKSETTCGLRAAQYFVIQQMKKHAPLSVNDLAAHTCSHQSTISVVVDDLVKLGHVDRTPAPKDRRKMILTLTPSGLLIAKQRRATVQDQMLQGLKKMPSRKRRQLAVLLEEFVIQSGLNEQTPHFFFEMENGKKNTGPRT